MRGRHGKEENEGAKNTPFATRTSSSLQNQKKIKEGNGKGERGRNYKMKTAGRMLR